jgi:hypothetical protein
MLDYRVVVRKVSTGSTPFGWEVRDIDALTPVHVSTERFRSMETAYKDGCAWLADFLSRFSPAPRTKTEKKPLRVTPGGQEQRPPIPATAVLLPAAPELASDADPLISVRSDLVEGQLIGAADPTYPSQIG